MYLSICLYDYVYDSVWLGLARWLPWSYPDILLRLQVCYTHSASLQKYIQCKHTSTEAHTVQAVQDMFYTFIPTLPWSHIVWPAPAQAVFSSCFSLVHCFSRLLWAELFTRFTLCSTFHCTETGFSLRLVGGDVPVLELQLHFGCTSITMGRTGTVHKA